jgi:3-methyladenine DNA glycosylase AlkD
MSQSTHQPYSGIYPANARNVPELRVAAKDWTKRNKSISANEFQKIVTSLIDSSSSMKKCMGGILLSYMPAQRKTIDPLMYESWLGNAAGWAEVDALCYGIFTAEEILGNFKGWEQLIQKLSHNANINKRRAALVLLTKPVHRSPDSRLSRLSFSIIDTMKHEKEILITKAISWLVRKLLSHHQEEVKEYLHSNKNLLPKIAIRETLNKIRSGRKSGL